MKTGISLYPGLDGSEKKMPEYIQKAAELGIKRVFTSLHIPESDAAALRPELSCLLQTARYYQMDVIADISPQACAVLGIRSLSPLAIQELGITTVRLDFGFTIDKAALFSRFMSIQLNASTIRPDTLYALKKVGADLAHIDALHNFYPRPYTGLSESYAAAQTRWLQSKGITVGAFIASQHGRRGPLQEGLPTLEQHRNYSVSLAARHLAALGMNSVFIGDPVPSDNELCDLADTGREEKDTVVLKGRLLNREPYIRDLLSHTFTARWDPAADVIRAQEGRTYISDHIVHADTDRCRIRQRGDITVDTAAFLRYMGEVQIVLRDLPAERRTCIAAQILPEEEFLLPYITPGRKFRFEWIR